MPVSATSEKDILRVAFPVQGEDYDAKDPHRYETEVICFLRVSDAGLTIYYSHHSIRVRDSTIGPFTGENQRRMALTPALTALIEQGVFCEFWSVFLRNTITSPARIGKMPTDVDPEEVQTH